MKTLFMKLLIVLPLIGISIGSFAESADKSVYVVPANTDLEINFRPTKNSFRVGESMRFEVSGNKPFYLYVYSVDKNTGKSVLLLPNKEDARNYYTANEVFSVPNPTVDFISDGRDGSELIKVVATTNSDDIGLSRFMSAGQFYSVNTKDLESQFQSKGILVLPRNSRSSELDVQIMSVGIER